MHVKDIGPSLAYSFNSGTKSTERIIGEMQGKTTELQCLDAQPTFRNIPDLTSKCCDESDEIQATREEVEIGSDDSDRRLVDSVNEDDVNLKGKRTGR